MGDNPANRKVERNLDPDTLRAAVNLRLPLEPRPIATVPIQNEGSLIYNLVDDLIYYSDGLIWIPIGAGLSTLCPIEVGIGASTLGGNDDSIAVGCNALASGDNAIALGSDTTGGAPTVASGLDSLAIGAGATSAGARSQAIGDGASATDDDAIAIGDSATADNDAIAIGSGASATGDNAIGIGGTISNAGSFCIHIGGGSTPSTSSSCVSIGFGSGPGGFVAGATIVGDGATASSDRQIIIGESCQGRTLSTASIMISPTGEIRGLRNIAIGDDIDFTAGAALATDNILIGTDLSIGSGFTDTVNIGRGTGAATDGVNIGRSATAGASGVAIGSLSSTVASGVALGTSASVTMDTGVAIGAGATSAGASGAVALGTSSAASGDDSLCFGSGAGCSVAAEDAIAIGTSATCADFGNIVIGRISAVGIGAAPVTASIAIGDASGVLESAGFSAINSTVLGQGSFVRDSDDAIAIGRGTSVGAPGLPATSSIAIGALATIGASSTGAVAIGPGASAPASDTIALGNGAATTALRGLAFASVANPIPAIGADVTGGGGPSVAGIPVFVNGLPFTLALYP